MAAVTALIAGGVTAVVHMDDDSSPRASGRAPQISAKTRVPPTSPIGDQPRHRVYVDNSGPVVSISVRSSPEPWSRSLDLTVNDRSIHLDRKTTPEHGHCAPKVTAEPSSLLTRVDLPRTCLKRSRHLEVTVTEDGKAPVKAKARKTQRPNVLMIMVDDMRTDDLQWMPNVQKLIGDQGVNFTNGFASLPLCCPARASVLTGLYPHNHQVWSHVRPWAFTALDDSSTFPVWIHKSGYRTSYMGKYLNYYGADPEPGKTTGTSTQYVPPGWDKWQASIDGGLDPSDPNDGGTYRYFDTTLNDNGHGYIALEGKYQTDEYARMTGDIIDEEAAGKAPFFHYLSFAAPHVGGPHEADDPDLPTPARPTNLWGIFDKHIKKAPGADWHDKDQSDKPLRMRGHIRKHKMAEVLQLTRQRAEALYSVDQAVKQLMGRLRETGELKNTLVVFTSDNGFFLGEQNIPSGKVLPYEPSLRVPVLMRGPGIPKGEVRTDPFLSVDYAETFADLADAPVPGSTDGRSLVDVARLGDETDTQSWSRVVPTETPPNSRDTRRLRRHQPVGAHTKKMLRGLVTGIRTSQYLYTEWNYSPGDEKNNIDTELYDVLADPNQYRNLAVEPGHEKLLAQLHDVLVRARSCKGDECRVLLPENLR
ncbi:hypothetical protein ASG90_17280 [Nocardioides sp. Soil797]|nr:hypothetical protein ASG90_17280 [Nocardioides sp. Soil797]